MKFATLVSVLSFSLSVFAGPLSKTYKCTSSNLNGEIITIVTQSNAYNTRAEGYFTISTNGVFPEFDGFDYDLAVCAFEGMYGDKNIQSGMFCQGISLAGNFDYKTAFTIQSNELSSVVNPISFSAILKKGNRDYKLNCLAK